MPIEWEDYSCTSAKAHFVWRALWPGFRGSRLQRCATRCCLALPCLAGLRSSRCPPARRELFRALPVPGQGPSLCCPFCRGATALLPEPQRARAFEKQVIKDAGDSLLSYLYDECEGGHYEFDMEPLEDDPIVSVCASGHVTAAWTARAVSAGDEGDEDDSDDEVERDYA